MSLRQFGSQGSYFGDDGFKNTNRPMRVLIAIGFVVV